MIYHRKLSFSAACLVFMLTAAFTSISAKTYASIGIIGAIEEEISSIKKETDVKSILNIGGRTFYVGKCGGQDIVLVKSEIGKVNAAITAQILIRDFRTESIIFTGVAGGIDPKLQPGDIVISTKMIQHDYGILSKETMKPWKLTVPGETGTRQYDGIDADPSLIEIAWTAAQNTRLQEVHYKLGNPKKRKPIVVKGIIATGDQFIESTKKREWLFEQFGASAVEMEVRRRRAGLRYVRRAVRDYQEPERSSGRYQLEHFYDHEERCRQQLSDPCSEHTHSYVDRKSQEGRIVQSSDKDNGKKLR